MKKIIFPFLILSLLCACSANEESVKIEDKSFAKTLFVQKVEDNSSQEELTKKITDELKIKETLELMDGLKVKKEDSNHVFDMMKSKDTYMFSFFKTDDITGVKIVPYVFNIMEDGTIIFTHKGVDSLQEGPLVTTEEHKELLNRIRTDLEIDF